MLKQLEQRKIEKLEADLRQAHRIIWELIGGMEHPDREIRQLIHDTAESYIRTVYANRSGHEYIQDSMERKGAAY